MNRIVNNKYQEEYYEETMSNGLKVQLWHKKDFKKSKTILQSRQVCGKIINKTGVRYALR